MSPGPTSHKTSRLHGSGGGKEEGLYRTREDPDKPKFYALDFFPYPSGDGLSVGHCRNYIPTDTYSRFMRMRGYTVLHPMGWDAFGEPTENKAIEVRESPRALTDRYTDNYKRQMRLVGISFDWDREIDSSLPEYYRWTQWFFLLLHKRGLAYRDTNWQWWCPFCQTTMSNQEVQTGDDGELFCWRDHPGVTKKQIPAWFFKITAYAEQLLADLSEIDWPSRIKLMQENWIGRSTGTDIVFTVDAPTADGGTERVEMPVFTTRPDTVFGVTFMVLAPEHELVQRLTTPERRAAVEAYVEHAKRQSEIERTATEREKNGIFTGAYATNPLNGEQVPIWVADYVLATYGTGMVMGVPAHDQRDFEFAQEFGLDIKVVIAPPGWDGQPLTKAYVGPGEMVNSGSFDGTFTRANWPKLPPAERAELAAEWEFTVEALDQRLDGQAQGRHRVHLRCRRRTRLGPAGSQLPDARLADLAPALLGWPHPDHPLPELRRSARAGGRVAGATAQAGRHCPWRRRSLPAGPRNRLGQRGLARSVAARHSARPTRWGGLPAHRGISCASPARTIIRGLSTPRERGFGCRWICTSAAPSTPSCTCSTLASGTR